MADDDDSKMNISDLDRLLADCLEHVDQGETLDPEALIRQYPQHAEGLRAFFIGNAQLEQMRQTGGAAAQVPYDRRVGDYVIGDEIQGRYRLLQLIGEGGMGAVWLAQQTTPVKRRVAIKLIRAGMDSKLVLARFDAERQALAMMDHPNIARVYDGGMTERGRPFFVMEYLRGTPLTDYCDQARLSIRERMELFQQVCRAVQHAHTKGIVHRDLKPSNILVCQYDGRPVTKVIDFGLAKALNQDLTDLTLHTAHGVMVGTPIYMSPEQAELNNLDLDTRTDVYSLGVVLYELLTGTTPLDRDRLQRAAMQEVLRLIREEDPMPPSTRLSSSQRLPLIAAQRNVDPSALRNSVTGDLDWIVMKAIEKERGRRYETVVGLAEDIQRFLTDDVVRARPPGLLYRLSRLARRHRVRVLAVGAVLTGVLAAAVGLGWGWKKSTQASTQLQHSLSQMQTERSEKQQAQDAAQQQRQAADRFLAEGILRSIGLSGYEDSIGISGEVSQAEFAALRAWASLPDDSQRIRVLEIGLSDAASARQLAARPISVLRACVGLSTARRESVLKLLAEKQRCGECVPEVRGVSCLLTAALGGTNLQALADVGSLKVPLQDFQKNIWRILPALPMADRNRLLEFLLTPDSTTQPAAYQMQVGADEFVLDDAVKDSAELLWKRILSDMRTKLATLKTDAAYDAFQVPNEELLPSVIKSLPEAMIPEAVSQILDLMEARPPGVTQDILSVILLREPYLQLLRRLTVADAAVTAQRIVGELTIDENRISMATAYLEILLPKLSAADIGPVRRQLFTILPGTQPWHTSSRWKLATLLEQCINQLPPGDLEPIIGEVLQLTDQGQLPTVQEVLSPTIVKLIPLMTREQVEKLWNDLLVTMRNAERSEQSEW
ncbi:MAG: serine/threonine-protein kinase, partial [Planctomycetia bacterium]